MTAKFDVMMEWPPTTKSTGTGSEEQRQRYPMPRAGGTTPTRTPTTATAKLSIRKPVLSRKERLVEAIREQLQPLYNARLLPAEAYRDVVRRVVANVALWPPDHGDDNNNNNNDDDDGQQREWRVVLTDTVQRYVDELLLEYE